MKLFVAEAGSAELVRFVEATDDREKTISALAFIEVRSAIRRRERTGEISPSHAASAVAALQAESRRVIEVPVSPPVLSRASALVDTRGLRALDAIQLATVLLVKDGLQGGETLTFVCSDEKLLEAAEYEGVVSWNPANS